MKTRNIALCFGVIFYLYLTTTVAEQIGLKQVGTASTILIVLLAVENFFRYEFRKFISLFAVEFSILAISIAIIMLKVMIGDGDGIRFVIFFLVIPFLLAILLGTQDEQLKSSLQKIILIFFVTECTLAIAERLMNFNAFPYEETMEYIQLENLGFRSTAFLGHPLQNALCVSLILGFILTSARPLIHKMALFMLGYIALLSFNAKGATLVWSILIFIYLISIFFKKEKSDRREFFSYPVLLALGAGFLLIYELIINQDFGDRFFQGELIDDSAKSRLDITNSFDDINLFDFLFGNSENAFNLVQYMITGGYENSYIIIILNFGLIFFIIGLYLYYKFIRNSLISFATFDKYFVLSSFLIVGSMNNSLATTTPWMIFIICVRSFSIERIKHGN